VKDTINQRMNDATECGIRTGTACRLMIEERIPRMYLQVDSHSIQITSSDSSCSPVGASSSPMKAV